VDLNKELETARELAIGAGAILLEYYKDAPNIEWKGENDPVTSADRAASRFIVDALRDRFPLDGILCEEEKDDLKRLGNPRVWVIDPMDGTKEFIKRRGEFSVMIGLAIEGRARVGAVYQPTERKLYYAAPHSGAFLTHAGVTRALHVSPESDKTKVVMALSRSHLSSDTEAIRKNLGIEHTTQTGSLGLKVGLLCESAAHVYVQGRGTSLWDTCGPEAILFEAGGKMTDKRGDPFRYDIEDVRNHTGVVATNGVLHDDVVEAARALL
jgi:3'(2'), 5'-bisphosphate nucleotidase